MRIGELCAGYGGLGMGIQALFGGDIAWVADNDVGASQILDCRFPNVPNLGDITRIDWGWEQPVDVLAAGFPCQDVSAAGQRRGLRAGTRTGVWAHVARAVEELRPPLVVLENVRGLLSADADSDMEPCPWCLGETGHQRSLRAAGAVCGDLASLGYDTVWRTVPASAAWAPHRRERAFFLAWPADTPVAGLAGAAGLGESQPWQRRRRPAIGGDHPAPDAGDRADAERPRRPRRPERERPPVRGVAGAGSETTPPDPAGEGPERCAGDSSEGTGRVPVLTACEHQPPVEWGTYRGAISRWESVLGREAPPPTEPGRNGPRLSAAFTEWMMGLPQGWVTQVPGLSRREQLKALGNGVVPQQAALALQTLYKDMENAQSYEIP